MDLAADFARFQEYIEKQVEVKGSEINRYLVARKGKIEKSLKVYVNGYYIRRTTGKTPKNSDKAEMRQERHRLDKQHHVS